MPRRVCVVTGSRAEWGIMRFLVKRLHAAAEFDLSLVATGMHLAPEFGLTVREIESDGVPVSCMADMLLSSDSSVGVAKSVGVGILGLADAFRRLAPELVLLCGDRFEMLAAASTALLMGIPIAHIHGGETTQGSLDEGVRHAITKMAHLHFVAALPYRDRVVQMGEAPERVFHVGAPVLDSIRSLTLLDRQQLEAELNVSLQTTVLVVTFHPETAGNRRPDLDLDAVLGSLAGVGEATIVLTASNADAGGRAFNDKIEEFAAADRGSRVFVASLGQLHYFSLLAQADLVVGNSSSALIEAPFFSVPSVNIGDRQRGRARGSSVFDCPCDIAAIHETIQEVLTRSRSGDIDYEDTPYGRGGASESILAVLRDTDFTKLGPKVFVDRYHA